MVLALAALAAAAASFPTGFGFGAGYGAGVRIGYDVIYPKIAPFAAKITDDIIGQVAKLFGNNANIPVESSATSGFDFGAPADPAGPGPARGRQDDVSSVATSNRKTVTIRTVRFSEGFPLSDPTQVSLSVDELRALVDAHEKRRASVGLKSGPGRKMTRAINTMHAAIATF